LFFVLLVAGCTVPSTRTGQVPDPPYSPDNIRDYPRDRGGDGGGGGGGGAGM